MSLLPCPFDCGETEGDDPHLDTHDVNGLMTSFHFVSCPNCGATGPRRATKREATAAWNQRARTPDVVGRDGEADRG